MIDVGKVIKVFLLVSPLALSACAITAPPAPDLELREAALTRWSQCIHRFSASHNGSIRSVRRNADRHCDGYRRDVLATFPPHLENQVDSLLSQRSSVITTSRFVKTDSNERSSEQQRAPLDTLRERLLEAQQLDL